MQSKKHSIQFREKKNYYLFLFSSQILLAFSLIVSISCQGQQIRKDSLYLQQNLVQAQIEYYQNQTKEKSIIESLTPAILSLIGTFVGASLAFLGVRWSSDRQWKLEKQKWEKDQALEIRNTASEWCEILAVELQCMLWLLYIAKHDHEGLSEENIRDYLQETREAFKKELAIQAHLIVLDTAAHGQMKAIADEISDYDHDISSFIKSFRRAKDEATKGDALNKMADLYGPLKKYYNNIADRFSAGLSFKTG